MHFVTLRVALNTNAKCTDVNLMLKVLVHLLDISSRGRYPTQCAKSLLDQYSVVIFRPLHNILLLSNNLHNTLGFKSKLRATVLWTNFRFKRMLITKIYHLVLINISRVASKNNAIVRSDHLDYI